MKHPWRLALLLIGLCSMLGVAEARLYRWVDDDGTVHYTDTLPPSQVTQGHTELNERGLRLKTVPPAKTLEEVQREQELERLRAQQERLIEQQKAADRVLLRTFRSEDDIIMARDGKIAAIDAMIQVTRNNIRRQQEWLAGLRSEAADLERAGKPVPRHLKDSIAKTERSIGDAYAAIVERENQKKEIRAGFERDLSRFRQLNNIDETRTVPVAEDVRHQFDNIVTCGGESECRTLWERASAYVQRNSATPVQTGGANVIITAPPANDDEVSLILSRINDKDGEGATLFLDVQCARSPRGEAACQGEKAREIIAGFRPAVRGSEESAP